VFGVSILSIFRLDFGTSIGLNKHKLENMRGPMKTGQSRETGIIGYKRQRTIIQKHNTIHIGHHCKQTNTNNIDKTAPILPSILKTLSHSQGFQYISSLPVLHYLQVVLFIKI
jgi:hypothetical protein